MGFRVDQNVVTIIYDEFFYGDNASVTAAWRKPDDGDTPMGVRVQQSVKSLEIPK